jgi:hypothetical protein
MIAKSFSGMDNKENIIIKGEFYYLVFDQYS